jgi:hypothetical protein
MLLRKQTRGTNYCGSIRDHRHEIFVAVDALVFIFFLTLLLGAAAPKGFARTGSPVDGDAAAGALAEADALAERPIPPTVSAELATVDGGLPTEASETSAEFAAIRFTPAIPEPPGIFEDHTDAGPSVLPKACFLHSQNFCRALKDRRVVLLGGLQTGALISDGISTRQFLSHGYSEVDPVAKIFIGSKPTWGRMAPIGAAQVFAGMWLGERMATSRHPWVRRFWWLPQTLGIAGNVAATVHNLPLHR